MAVAHLTSPNIAAQTIRQEHERLAEALMLVIDLLGDVQNGLERVKLENLRRATGSTLRKSLLARERALFVLLGVEVTDDELRELLHLEEEL